MSATRPGAILRHLHPADPDDAALLARYAGRRDPAAFAALVRRHGPVVLAVCRRVTGHPQDAEDAFQAAFLVLARSAGTVRSPERLGSWLYGVAVKVAGRARRTAARRREVTVAAFPDVPAPDPAPPPDIGPALHEELAALPALHREPIVLCDLNGMGRADAAKVLGIPEGTLSSRLANGRKRLAERLTRRGVALSAAALPAAVAGGRAAVPDELVLNTCGLAAAWAAGGAVPAAVLRLARGGFPMRGVILGGVLSVALAAGAVFAAGRPDAPRPADPPPAPVAVAALGAEEPPPKKDDAPATLRAPRLAQKADLNLKTVRAVAWSPDGKWLAVQGAVAGNADGVAVAGPRPGGGANEVVVVPFADARAVQNVHPLPAGAAVVGFTADGRLLVHARESGLISGSNALQAWTVSGAPPNAEPKDELWAAQVKYAGAVEIPDAAAAQITPAAAKNTLRYLVRETDAAVTRKVTAWTTDERFDARWPNGSFEGAFVATQLTPDAMRVLAVVAKTGAVEAYDLEGKRLWASDPAPKEEAIRYEPAFKGGFNPDRGLPPPSAAALVVAASRTGSRVLTVRTHAVAVLDGATGKALPPPAGVAMIDALGPAAVSADGRLVALAYSPLTKAEPKGGVIGGGAAPPVPGFIGPQTYTRGAPHLAVWDTTSGRVVRSWPGRAAAVAFHPTRPVLAVLEPNGTETRLGFWEFLSGD